MNIVYKIEIENRIIAHFGDSEFTAESLLKMEMKDSSVDLALVPTWFLTANSDYLDVFIGAKKYIGIHARKNRSLSTEHIFSVPGEQFILE